MSIRTKSRTWTQIDKFYHKKPNQLIYDQFPNSIFCSRVWLSESP
jgi:hypothetical protein